MSSKVSSPVEEARKSGIFGRMSRTKKKKTSGSSRNLGKELTKMDSKKKDNNMGTTVHTSNVSTNGNIQGRRVVKATPPPSSAPPQNENTPPTNTSSTTTDDDLGPEKNASGNNHPSNQTEALREKTEQWRKERIDATAAVRKENKEKDVMEHRSRSGSTVDQKEEVAVEAEPVPAILTVAPQFPEHKRKAAPDEHSGKKSKVAEEETEVGAETEVEAEVDGEVEDDMVKVEKKAGGGWSDFIPGWVAAAAVVAAAGIFATRCFRNR